MKKISLILLKRKALSHLTVWVLVGGMLLSSAQPARAQYVVTQTPVQWAAQVAQWGKDVAYYAAEATAWYQQHVQSVIQTQVTAITGWMQANLEIKITNTTNANNRTTANAAVTAQRAAEMALPPGYSSCRNAQAARGRSEALSGARSMGGAMTLAGNKRPDGPSSNAQDIQAEMNDGLVPCSPQTSAVVQQGGGSSSALDPDGSAYHAMQCVRKWNGDFEDADLSMDVLFGSYASYTGSLGIYELPVPPQFGNLNAGAYQPIPLVTSEKYMPFVAAYSFCQRINPRRLPVPPADKANPTAAVLLAGLKNDADARMNSAYTICNRLLTERMQIASNISAFAVMYNQQLNVCTADAKRHWLDATDAADCTTNGRSLLQSEYDEDNRDAYAAYNNTYLSGADAATIYHLDGVVHDDHDKFLEKIDKDQEQLTAAMADAQAAERVYINAVMAQPINK